MFANAKRSLRNVMFCLFVMCIFLTKITQIADCSPINEGQLDDLAIKYSDLLVKDDESIKQAQKATSQENTNDVESLEGITRKLHDANVEKVKVILESILRKNSLYNTLPFDPDMFEQYMNDYINSINKRLQMKNMKKNTQNVDERKRAACGNLNGSPMHKWICW